MFDFERLLVRYAAATGLTQDQVFDCIGAMDERELVAAVAYAEDRARD